MPELANPKTAITILYGSDTGTAQDYAIFLSKRLKYLSLKPRVAALDEYPLKNLVTETQFLIVICATAGQGEVPRNGKKFMRFILKKKLPPDLLNHLYIATFGLGDSSYPKFNYAIKKIHTRLLQLGCKELTLRCEADEQSPEGLDGYYTEWESHLMTSIKGHFPSLKPLNDSTILRPQNTVLIDKAGDDVEYAEPPKQLSCSRINVAEDLKIGTIDTNRRITGADHFQDVRHLVIRSQGLEFVPGDTVGMFPSNSSQMVQTLLESQKLWLPFADKPLSIKGTIPHIEGGLIEARHLTLRTLLTHHLDIMAIPTRSFFFSLWHYVDGSTEDGAREKEKLQDFCNLENSEELYNYANRPRRSIFETLLEFENNLTIPVEHVFDLLPKVKPRLFSIASKPDPQTVELLVGIVEYQTIIKRTRKGFCSSWIKTLQPGDPIVFSLHRQGLNFELANGDKPPVILVSTGTGVAPVKSLVEHITQTGDHQLYMFYGFRNEEQDFLFKDLWLELQRQGKLSLFPCISRSGVAKKQYVQNGLFEQRQVVGDLIVNQNAIVYVCGSSGAMPRQVRQTIMDILEGRDSAVEEVDQYLRVMENSGRYIQETW
ncbi:NAPDH-dependent diflavin reductase [Yamadazyma tenuis]|uniref:NADPH-dependent diflavin oxidoreductase 1 n=1 Tax=Candida tenuis (strain ATCC 10573 / BCRC 21748 / CBS 615 / JCM 9827 / NBRC 10315 / NRRL Y-1498 / VKM Y-70) TaxID=590646 RepID=G3BC75_CANTC|nr:uncharacterized protein CANTEDRAFT_127056 [Yamadazyma tenuis ATCC 10573]EGV60136.1 hypothetical protein CANTEDRAFT_127056 [Yamadazyma tenuis ATCC 10573]WEJ94630.1 NAPDH-dependent diflavin reductase [Yamadazyma tenuis]